MTIREDRPCAFTTVYEERHGTTHRARYKLTFRGLYERHGDGGLVGTWDGTFTHMYACGRHLAFYADNVTRIAPGGMLQITRVQQPRGRRRKAAGR